MIKITSYGKDVVTKMFVASMIMAVAAVFINIGIIKFLLFGLAVFLWIFTLYFFRDPVRKLPSDYKISQVISPADGKVVVIEEIPNESIEFFGNDSALMQVSIFLSPLNVHVNRIPISGTVSYLKYIKGDYIVAFNKKSSSKNERNVIGITEEKSGKKILFTQIAGYVARRIVCELKTGSSVKAGDKFGMIKFGSRVDMLFDKNSKIQVALNQKVVAGETIIAEL